MARARRRRQLAIAATGWLVVFLTGLGALALGYLLVVGITVTFG